ncbi:MAG: RNA methyltransferase [Flavobacterium sp. MedPE-SWcel]|uniref:TrmH family RNA methyltransferase n=1 Tax=uncultured Flavobacterium sp. TaxID=165435 RepID=UPI000913C7E1|nr:TrmH family RNA methyltransferase [uncultured Flavobacterium sp.]OIQ16575.1 MAG: RNA methyltransferase [Flavobacterium sp. MedPE-SWcel]
MSQQLNHSETSFAKRTFPITLICDNISYQPNIGSIFRICEAFGVQNIIFVGEDIALTPRKINRTSRSTHLRVPHKVIESTNEVLEYLQQNDFEIIALEITDTSKSLQELALNNEKPIALIAGSEVNGISKELLQIAHQTTHITMYGENSSMNVVNAVSVALYDITSKIS